MIPARNGYFVFTKLVSVVPCQETKEGCKKGEGTGTGTGTGTGAGTGAQAQTGAETVSAEDETALDALAESLALAGAMATLQLNEDLHLGRQRQ